MLMEPRPSQSTAIHAAVELYQSLLQSCRHICVWKICVFLTFLWFELHSTFCSLDCHHPFVAFELLSTFVVVRTFFCFCCGLDFFQSVFGLPSPFNCIRTSFDLLLFGQLWWLRRSRLGTEERNNDLVSFCRMTSHRTTSWRQSMQWRSLLIWRKNESF